MQGSQVVFIVFTWTCFIKWPSYKISNYSCIQSIVCHSFFTCQSVEYTVMNWHLTCAVMSVTSGMSWHVSDIWNFLSFQWHLTCPIVSMTWQVLKC